MHHTCNTYVPHLLVWDVAIWETCMTSIMWRSAALSYLGPFWQLQQLSKDSDGTFAYQGHFDAGELWIVWGFVLFVSQIGSGLFPG